MKYALRTPGVVASHFADIVWLERELLPGRFTLEGRTGRPRLFDVDDALWLQGSAGFSERIMRACNGVIAGNEFLAAHYRAAGARAWVVPTAVDTDVWTPGSAATEGSWTIGWIGTSSNLPYLASLEGPLAAFLGRRREARLLIVSDLPPTFTRLPGERWRFVPWSAKAEVALVQQMDVGLMPLPDTDWARGKCSAKMLLYMAAAVPVVVSPVGTNAEVLAHGEVGLAARDPKDWIQALETLFRDRERSLRMGRTGRDVVEAEYSVRQIAPRLAAIFRELAEAR
jgi:glycosyltransferase involved in cell wall biosynthesis